MKTTHTEPSRRDLLKGMGCGIATLMLSTALAANPSLVEASSGVVNEKAWGLLVDLTRCTGCQSCALACKDANDRPHPKRTPIALDTDAYSFVDERRIENPVGQVESVYVKRQCMHCLHPACVSACTVGALRKTAEGPVVYDAEKCIGCRYCQYACPFGVPTYEWENPLGLIHKCQMCTSRLDEDESPACVAACPNGALRFGPRQQLLAQARAQIASNSGRYVEHIYGEHEVGGTSVLYLSPVPFSALGFPALGEDPNPRYAEAVMRQTPAIALTVASVVTALHLFMQRRQQVKGEATLHIATQKPGAEL
ncbi:MAG: 4Fe-4S dicluster domain-containing protein [Caldilineaceae bacterium]|nr:4Fe-4S dicluster domain-containing protein [Caldilineaceae bacterium]HRJ41338.1 4Fe-4S dicluster domain-containing protein [Caldilineaceae bacterium]